MLEGVEIFLGQSSALVARVYARLQLPTEVAGVKGVTGRLTGRIVGPYSQYARTLPATVPLIDRGPGPTALAEATLVDPCYWTAEQPFLYRVELEWQGSDGRVETQQTTMGLRSGGAAAQGARSVVLRVVSATSITSTTGAMSEPWKVWRDAGAAVALDDPDTDVDLLEAASQQGVPVVATLAAGVAGSRSPAELHATIAERVPRIAQWPCVGAVVLPSSWTGLAGGRLEGLWANFSLAVAIAAGADRAGLPTWARLVIVDLDDQAPPPTAWLQTLAETGRALYARRRLPQPRPLAEARRECDRLQADLAGYGRWAGYIV